MSPGGDRRWAIRAPVGELYRRHRPVRCVVLPHRAGGGAASGPAAAAAAGDELGGAGGGRDRPRGAEGQPLGRIRGHLHQRIPGAASPGSRGVRQRLYHDRQQSQHRDRAGGVHAGAGRSGDRGGHGLLVVAGGAAPGGGEPSARRERPRAGRRGERAAVAGEHRAHGGRRDAVAGRPVQDVRCGGGRLRARRGLRDGGAEASVGRGGGGGPDLGSGAWLGGEPGRGERGSDGAERSGAGAGDRRGATACRTSAVGGGLPGGARDGDGAWGSGGGACGGGGVRAGPCARTTSPHRLGEDEHRPSGIRGRDCGLGQGGAVDASRCDTEASALREAESADGLGAFAAAGGVGGGGVAGGGASDACRSELVRVLGDERARDCGESRGAWRGRCGSRRGASGGVGGRSAFTPATA